MWFVSCVTTCRYIALPFRRNQADKLPSKKRLLPSDILNDLNHWNNQHPYQQGQKSSTWRSLIQLTMRWLVGHTVAQSIGVNIQAVSWTCFTRIGYRFIPLQFTSIDLSPPFEETLLLFYMDVRVGWRWRVVHATCKPGNQKSLSKRCAEK